VTHLASNTRNYITGVERDIPRMLAEVT